MSEQFPVTVAVNRPDGSVEQVRVGTATRTGEGFSLSLGAMSIGGTPVAAAPRAAAPTGPGGEPTVFPPYGRSKGMPIRGASLQDLEFYKSGCLRTLNDPGKARFHDKERGLLAVIEAELKNQGGGGGGGGGFGEEPPPPGDEDAPF